MRSASTRRPRLAPTASGAGPAWIAAVATLVAGAAAVWGVRAADAAAARAGGVGGASLAAAVRRLRAATVGDVDARGAADSAVAAARPAPRDPGRRLTTRAARRALAARAGRVTPGVPWWADSANWGPEVVRWTTTTREPLVLDAGDTAVVAGPAIPAALPEALRRRGVFWSADGAVEVAADPAARGARVVARAPGEAGVTATTPAGRTVTPVLVRPAVRGALFPADGGPPPAARVVVARGDAADTLWTDAGGRFRGPLPPAWDGDADVWIEPLATPNDRAPNGAAAYAGVRLAGVPAARLHTLGVVLLPARWTVTAGRYAGSAVPVRAAAARGFWRFAGAGGRRPVGWGNADEPPAAPRPVAFERGPYGEVDTATFWRAARAVEAAWGRPLFRPADAAQAGADGPDLVVGLTPGLGAAAVTTLAYDATGAVAGGRVEFRSPGASGDARVVAHELLHALGYGHARGWPSVLAPFGAGMNAPTAADVAYAHLFEALRLTAARAERAYGGAYGWADAVR